MEQIHIFLYSGPQSFCTAAESVYSPLVSTDMNIAVYMSTSA